MYSHLIDIMCRFLRTRGVVVHLYATLPTTIAGRCDYAQRTISLQEPTARGAFDTLRHEFGHWRSYEVFGHIPQRLIPRCVRELLAEYFAICVHLHLITP